VKGEGWIKQFFNSYIYGARYLKVPDMPLFNYLVLKPRGFKCLLNLLLKESTEGFAGIRSPGRLFQIEVQRRMKLFLKYLVLGVSFFG
jgi:hypothetical protein